MGCMRGGWVACGNGNNQPISSCWLVALVGAIKDCIELGHGLA